MKKLILEIDIDTDPSHAGDQVSDAIAELEKLKNQLYSGKPVKNQSDIILDTTDDDELLGTWRIDC